MPNNQGFIKEKYFFCRFFFTFRKYDTIYY